MLTQTRRAVETLKEAGLKRSQFRIRTPWKPSIKGYGDTTIVLLISYAQTAPFLQKLSKSFKVVVTLLDGIPVHVSIETAQKPGLYQKEKGRVEPVKEIAVKSSYEQLTFEEVL
jgi:hypothetical protein